MPLSFHWDGATVLLATPTDSPTGRNLASGRVARWRAVDELPDRELLRDGHWVVDHPTEPMETR